MPQMLRSPMDRIIFGDNQFFGINHMSEDKAQAQAERFQSLSAIIDVIDCAYDAGIRGFMFNTHERVAEICEHFRQHPTRYADLRIYPSMPYAHKYANAVNEKGLIGALNEFVLGGGSAGSVVSTIARGSKSVVTRNPLDVMRVLVDLEMRMFRGLNVRAVFLQNIVTDLLLGFGAGEIFKAFSDHVQKKYGVDAAFNSMNMPALLDLLEESGIDNPIICSSINKIGYMMSPDRDSYLGLLSKRRFRPAAMSILASGAVPAREAVQYVVDAGVQSIVFGASSENHIRQTVQLIDEAFDARNSDAAQGEHIQPAPVFVAPNHDAVRVKEIPVHSLPHEQVLESMAAHIDARAKSQHICITNTESMYFALRDTTHRQYIDRSAFSLCDGMGVVVAGRAGGKRIQRFNGPILLEKSVEYGLSRGWRHFFCGGREGVADTLCNKLSEKHPGFQAAGTYCPPFRDLTIEEERQMLAAINAAKPDIVWVGLGLLKQEAWITKFADRIDAPWLIGVGAAFDYHAGTARWAPAWIRNIGLEWLYRLWFEPRMLVRNYRSAKFMLNASLYEFTKRLARTSNTVKQ
jgi:exopolysaccharide biosynthesis WecB/TagA/CpsF family protein